MTESLQEPFRLGRVIRRSFSIWRRDLALLFVLVLVVSTPRILSAIYEMVAPRPDPPPYSGEPLFVHLAPILLRATGMNLVRSLFIHLSQAVVIFAVYERMRGGTPAFGGSLRGGLRRLWPVVGVAVVLFLLSITIPAAVLLLLLLEAWPFDSSSLLYLAYAAPVLTLIVLSPFWVAVPAAVVERSRNFLKRSWVLTRGRRLQVFLILLIVYAIEWGVGRLCVMVVPERPSVARTFLWWTQDLLLVAFAAVVAVVGYQALRLEKDGVDPSELEEVFA